MTLGVIGGQLGQVGRGVIWPLTEEFVASGVFTIVEPGDGYRYYEIDESGVFTVVSGSARADVLVVGGHGGGGGWIAGGGGGAGEVLEETLDLVPGEYPVTIGAGGVGGAAASGASGNGGDGQPTNFGDLTAAGGGGGGGGAAEAPGRPGASGGGGGSRNAAGGAGTAGHNGGASITVGVGSNAGGGGGGAGGVGSNGTAVSGNANDRGGNGGPGVTIWSRYTIAGGGGGGAHHNTDPNAGGTATHGGGRGGSTGQNGQDGTAGGGGGAGGASGTTTGGDGADGRVVVRVPLSANPPEDPEDPEGQVFIGGVAEGAWASNAGFDGGDTSLTFASPGAAVRATTTLRTVHVNSYQGSSAAKVKLFRRNGTDWDVVAEQGFTLAATAQTIDLSPPWDAQVGDVVGVWIQSDGAIRAANHTALSSQYATGDLTGSGISFTNTNVAELEIEVFGDPVDLAIVGDSILGGHTDWQTPFDTYSPHAGIITVPGGDPAFDIGAVIGGPSWVNYSRGSQSYEWAASTGVPAALTSGASTVLVGLGVNDIALGRSWEQVEGDLDTIRTLTVGRTLLVAEILPDTAFNDTRAATIRTWNENLAAWCDENDATLIETHDAMGQTRASTGELDDLADAYDKGDGVHLTSAGVAALAALVAPHL